MDYREILNLARNELYKLKGTTLDVVDIAKPQSNDYAKQLSKVISKLSPLLGNMIEFSTVELLNKYNWNNNGFWKRQDPGFPDALFYSEFIKPNPGIEIKTWFPLATEITARFKDSVSHFKNDQIDVALIAWLPENVIWGKPKIIDIWIDTAYSVAKARDEHYHRPPDYLVLEPEDTTSRTINLQQTNTNGYKFQGNKNEFEKARAVVQSWGVDGTKYSESTEYQSKLKSLQGMFTYRLDTNYAKIDRIEHQSLEQFKKKVLNTVYQELSINEWTKELNKASNELESELFRLF